MAFAKFFLITILATVLLQEIHGHGMMMDPVSRSSAWRKGFPTPKNWNDNELFCGGAREHVEINKGKCGICGDAYSLPQPRPNENGGKFGTGTIVRKYNKGEIIDVEVRLSANHRGTFHFNLCSLKNSKEIETEACFDKYPLKLADGSDVFRVSAGSNFKVQLRLPQGVACQHCVLRWHYRSGNSWGICPDGTGKLGCGPQETFRNCADVSIN